jgi:hypothetical protein
MYLVDENEDALAAKMTRVYIDERKSEKAD